MVSSKKYILNTEILEKDGVGRNLYRTLRDNGLQREIGSYRVIVICEDEEDVPDEEELLEEDHDIWANLLSSIDYEDFGNEVRETWEVKQNDDEMEDYMILAGS